MKVLYCLLLVCFTITSAKYLLNNQNDPGQLWQYGTGISFGSFYSALQYEQKIMKIINKYEEKQISHRKELEEREEKIQTHIKELEFKIKNNVDGTNNTSSEQEILKLQEKVKKLHRKYEDKLRKLQSTLQTSLQNLKQPEIESIVDYDETESSGAEESYTNAEDIWAQWLSYTPSITVVQENNEPSSFLLNPFPSWISSSDSASTDDSVTSFELNPSEKTGIDSIAIGTISIEAASSNFEEFSTIAPEAAAAAGVSQTTALNSEGIDVTTTGPINSQSVQSQSVSSTGFLKSGVIGETGKIPVTSSSLEYETVSINTNVTNSAVSNTADSEAADNGNNLAIAVSDINVLNSNISSTADILATEIFEVAVPNAEITEKSTINDDVYSTEESGGAGLSINSSTTIAFDDFNENISNNTTSELTTAYINLTAYSDMRTTVVNEVTATNGKDFNDVSSAATTTNLEIISNADSTATGFSVDSVTIPVATEEPATNADISNLTTPNATTSNSTTTLTSEAASPEALNYITTEGTALNFNATSIVVAEKEATKTDDLSSLSIDAVASSSSTVAATESEIQHSLADSTENPTIIF
ncbi:uncharacterized protein LOC106142255 [Amyelois transitella]|uniref:uncharacterized protein LOC106142255 n=1 Tax=Amyelois transitella TaxID=680683 RepID=UPI00298F6F6E|nr:uncharacterized protein LOC106142255 [Amyelois transitella]